jgi:hypothetical protein
MTWKERGLAPDAEAGSVELAVQELAEQPGIYRARLAESNDPWRFFYVDESGRAQDSGAASHIY